MKFSVNFTERKFPPILLKVYFFQFFLNLLSFKRENLVSLNLTEEKVSMKLNFYFTFTERKLIPVLMIEPVFQFTRVKCL